MASNINSPLDKKYVFPPPGIMNKAVAKFATHVVLFGQDKWIMRNLMNAYPHVEKIYVAYSEKPWNYNPNARNQYKNSFDINLIRNSEFADKVVIIEGVWDTEEQQRNACAEQAAKDGMDYLIIHDADEFYFDKDFRNLKKVIEENPDFDYYKVAWHCFWKSFNYVLLDAQGDDITGYPEFCINLKKGVRFASKRRPNRPYHKIITKDNGVCYHGSYVLTNEELLEKINTWGHTNDFNKDQWYKEKWLKWTEESTDLHLVSPSAWSKAKRFTGELPEVIANMK
jgi:hypothetical protein